jgi:hypothetical protein
MRRRGLSAQEAEHEVEVTAEMSFWEAIVFGIDRRLELWIALEEGLRAAEMFDAVETAMSQKFGEGTALIERVRREKREFVCMPAIDSPNAHR